MQVDMAGHYRRIGDNIYRFRVLQGLTQEELASRTNISSAFLSKIERADLSKGFSCSTIMGIADALNVPACILMNENMCKAHLEAIGQASAKAVESSRHVRVLRQAPREKEDED